MISCHLLRENSHASLSSDKVCLRDQHICTDTRLVYHSNREFFLGSQLAQTGFEAITVNDDTLRTRPSLPLWRQRDHDQTILQPG